MHCVCDAQPCVTLYVPMVCIPPGSSVRGILQARILEQIVIFSPRHLPDPGFEPESHVLQARSLQLSHWEVPCLA